MGHILVIAVLDILPCRGGRRSPTRDGSTPSRNTYIVYEDGEWKYRFSQEEYDLFMPDASYEEFAVAQQ